jgi:hypothetical protein
MSLSPSLPHPTHSLSLPFPPTLPPASLAPCLSPSPQHAAACSDLPTSLSLNWWPTTVERARSPPKGKSVIFAGGLGTWRRCLALRRLGLRRLGLGLRRLGLRRLGLGLRRLGLAVRRLGLGLRRLGLGLRRLGLGLRRLGLGLRRLGLGLTVTRLHARGLMDHRAGRHPRRSAAALPRARVSRGSSCTQHRAQQHTKCSSAVP